MYIRFFLNIVVVVVFVFVFVVIVAAALLLLLLTGTVNSSITSTHLASIKASKRS